MLHTSKLNTLPRHNTHDIATPSTSDLTFLTLVHYQFFFITLRTRKDSLYVTGVFRYVGGIAKESKVQAVDFNQALDLAFRQLREHLGNSSRRVITDARLRKLVVTDTEPAEYISTVGCQGLIVSNEVVADAARLTELVERLPVTVEWTTSSWVDDVMNKLSERHWTSMVNVRPIFPLDDGSNSPIVTTVTAKHTYLLISTRKLCYRKDDSAMCSI